MRSTTRARVVQNLSLRHACPGCGSVFHTRYALGLHMRSHAPGRSCQQCGQRFETRYAMWAHIRATGHR